MTDGLATHSGERPALILSDPAPALSLGLGMSFAFSNSLTEIFRVERPPIFAMILRTRSRFLGFEVPPVNESAE